MDLIRVTDIPGLAFGHAQDLAGATGCTVILCPEGAVGGVDVRGGAPGTRETDLLDPVNHIERIHAVLLAGGSAFGLDAAGGVMAYLEERGVGFDVGVTRVPIVAGAVLFDLTCGAPARPDKAMGYEACLQAGGVLAEGSVGAGTGATVGKLLGLDKAMKGGLGTCAFQVGDLMVGAVVAVNSLGDVLDSATGRIVAGAHRADPFAFLDGESALLEQAPGLDPFLGNTTIGCVVTNATLTKAQATKVAAMAQNGLARAVRPAHTTFDGDTLFTLATGRLAGAPNLNRVGVLAGRAVEAAILRAVLRAESLGGFRCASEVPAR